MKATTLSAAIVLVAATAAAAHADPCATLRVGMKQARCHRGASARVAGVGRATVYRARAAEWHRYALAIDGVLSPALDADQGLCSLGNCNHLVSTTPRLRRLRVDGRRAIALELTSRYRHFDHDAGGAATGTSPWTERAFLVCGAGATGAISCTTRRFGAPSESCDARLHADGTLTSSCAAPERITLP